MDEKRKYVDMIEDESWWNDIDESYREEFWEEWLEDELSRVFAHVTERAVITNSRILKILNRYGIKNLKDFMKTSIEDFTNMNGIGKLAIERISNLQNDNYIVYLKWKETRD